MMTQMAPMLEMMKAKMGKRRFAAMMQTMGPMMSRMMEGGGGACGLAARWGGGGIPSGEVYWRRHSAGIGGGYQRDQLPLPDSYGANLGGANLSGLAAAISWSNTP